ncbi:MAG TPA: hypothetical protein VG602_06605 [Actinomycetota bacterium]|nr:hypothetical protein [Actinomycetota bacterium]
MDFSCDYATLNPNSGTLTSPEVGVLTGREARIGFAYFTETECLPPLERCSVFDKTTLEVSFDGGSTWTELWSTAATTTAWTPVSLDFVPTSDTMRMRFTFNTIDGFDNEHIGTLVDDITVTFDDDGDGQSDADEATCGSDPADATSTSPDLDTDTIPDCVDSDKDGDGVANTSDAFPDDPNETTDTDGDSIGNNADTDDDGDGQSDAHETACGSNPLSATSTSADLDTDGTPDCVDTDRDGDGVANTSDVFPDDPNESTDTDGDSIGNNADTDDDGDGQSDADETACGSNPLSSSSTSADADEDGTADCVDPVIGTRVLPAGATILARTLRAGTATDLAEDDDRYFEVNSTAGPQYSTNWFASFTEVPNEITGLTVNYQGMNSRLCTQKMFIRNFSAGTWVEFDSQEVGTAEVPAAGSFTESLHRYVSNASGPGEVRIRVRCVTSSGRFFSSGDLLTVTYLT